MRGSTFMENIQPYGLESSRSHGNQYKLKLNTAGGCLSKAETGKKRNNATLLKLTCFQLVSLVCEWTKGDHEGSSVLNA